ncbi:hypothetical protein CCM_01995 [Cordyceps militaris CM01]|uniref:DUF7735 domain-containing protein n=1 Tax=Cordyceps militaris (strain CM01) TaxID=983644 RepID=G3JC08_CORMM|nr:uncharacterized protein CCM_01995 [Cordyceps militaris CM01]EGX93726.1 hypothetical protein CCM_01995 [Cordyceps militaris CM01]
MKLSSILALQPLAVAASVFDTILPTTAPRKTSDPWECSTRTLVSFFDVPKPTGALLDALLSFGDDLYASCAPTATNHVGQTVCAFPAHSRWCAFATAAPATVLPAYSSYASSASVWWSEHAADAAAEAEFCPNAWRKAMMWFANGPEWLNDTIAFAGCYAAAQVTGESSRSSSLPDATAGAGVTTPTSASKTATMTTTAEAQTPSKSSSAAAGTFGKSWVVIGVVVAGAGANILW